MRKYILLLFNIAILLMTTGCSDCGFGPDGPTHSVTVYIPYSNVTREGTTDGDDISDKEADISGKEGVITDLWFFAYPIGKGEAVVRRIDIDQLSSDNNYRVFYCDLKQGEYKIYLTANIPGISIYTTEDQLKAKTLDFSKGNLPVQGKLPLLYEYKNNEDNNKLEVRPNTSATITANMTFVCSKVKFSLRFDNTDTGFSKNSFGSNRLKITSITVKDIVTKGGLFDGKKNDGTQEQTLTVKNVDFNTDQWSYIDSLYLPENYTGKNTYLEIKGTELTPAGDETTITHTYNLPLGGVAGNKSGGDLERGTFYDMTASITGKGKMDMKINMSVFEWKLMDVYADFSQTSLWVSRTGKSDYTNFDHDNKTGQQILVTSQYNDSIGYKTNAKEVTVECVSKSKIGDKPLVLATPQSGQILFTVNPEILMGEYDGQTKGTAVVAIHANNLVKYIDVQYNVTPFLNVTPLEVEIHTEEGKESTYAVLFETNLGGITIEPTSLTSANNDKVTMKIEYTKGTSEGKIMLQSDGKATNTWTKSFTVSPISRYDNLKKQVKVTVIPPLNDYRIHFIALNDSRTGENGAQINTGNLTTDNKWPNYNIYLYTQYGMTSDNNIPQSVWYFFNTDGLNKEYGYWPGVSMRDDPENEGWKLFELPKNQIGSCGIPGANHKEPKSGETLIMFNSGEGNNAQRYPYEMEPGVQLFDFKNREGWFVYDPTSNLHEFFESKPDIHLVTFNMYYQGDIIDNWYINTGSNSLYGKANSQGFSKDVPSGYAGWKLSTLTFWCVKGREYKYVIVKKENGQEYGILFGGKRFKDYTGYYKDGSWHEGTPPTTTNTKQKRRTRR
ncbi:hypothetical protein [Segatella copri]|uniref:hypothetical protein n=1 Tax=Segatella copri TaxID=165179 RepID=UPI001290B296|nr:hypothetical protein [Segatella copri]MQN16874.1 hypothetical protein [Segatella copri]MQN17912.1 hypothetical protein [Segatella copri]